MRDFTGLSSENLSLNTLEDVIRDSLITYEPRLIREELVVKAVRPTSMLGEINVLSFSIRGKIWAEPLPQDFVLRTKVLLDTGLISVT